MAVCRVCSRTISFTCACGGREGAITDGRIRSTRLRINPGGISPVWAALRAAVTAPHESWPSTIMMGVLNSSTAYSMEPSTPFSITCPAVRTTKASPRPRSKMISAARRESPHPKMHANGNCPPESRVRLLESWLGCSLMPSTKRWLPSLRRFHACAGLG